MRGEPESSADLRRDRERQVAFAVLLLAAVSAVIVGLLPQAFSDPRSARVVVVAILIGVPAIALACIVLARLLGAMDRRAIWIALDEDSQARGLRLQGDVFERGRDAPGIGPLSLARVDLREAALSTVDLGGADLRFADLRGADLRAADLGGADLRGTQLQGAELAEANLAGAIYDRDTVWPALFAPPLRGDGGDSEEKLG